MCLSQKKPRTRNNEILSSYSSSKFLLTPGQKRPYQNGNIMLIYYNMCLYCKVIEDGQAFVYTVVIIIYFL